jgi:hypothetical protein
MEVKALDREMGQAMEVEVARVGMAVVEEVGVGVDMALAQLMVTVQLMGRPMAMDMVEAKEVMVMEQVEVKALDLEVGQAMEVEVEMAWVGMEEGEEEAVEVEALDQEVGQAMEVEVAMARVGMEVVVVVVVVVVEEEEEEEEVVEAALNQEVGQVMEVKVVAVAVAVAVAVVAKVGMEMGVEEKGLAQVMVVGQVMALDIEERKVKACREHKGYLFFYITPFIVICILK